MFFSLAWFFAGPLFSGDFEIAPNDLPPIHPTIFHEASFPPFAFSRPEEAQRILGPYKISARFFDAEFNEVQEPTEFGRYGAVIDLVHENGKPYRLYVTLYRAPDTVDWRNHGMDARMNLPEELGVSAEVLAEQPREMGEFLKYEFRRTHQDGTMAIFLAGLGEMNPGDTITSRNGYWERNTRWWRQLKLAIGDTEAYKYLIHFPEGYEEDENKTWPLMLFLHGAGERGTDLERVARHGPLREIRNGRDLPFIVVAPQCPANEGWDLPQLVQLISETMEKHRVDADRVYLTGLSMGGYGSFRLAAEAPELFAAVAPICGGGDPRDAERLKDLPFWVFHGDQDTVVIPRRSEEMVEAIREAGNPNVEFTLYPGVRHDSWTQTYANPEFYDWLLSHSRGE
ncbi:MAG: prolyl oligopeptidase family serine peptidase [Kiritimatiellae bacterium]|nr:prolyl oligopeptidase family serine peptidase [Kiritimatiellia bacterium]